MAEPDTSPPDISDILARYREDEKPAGDISDILSRYAGAKKTETGWMPTWLKHGLVGGAADLLSQASMSDPATMGNAITSEQAQHELESFTGPAPQPEGFLGRGASDVVRAATHPASWIGPGGPAAKAAFLTASGYGGEAGGTLAEKAGLGPAGQTVARVAGSLMPAGAAGLVGAVRAPRVRAAQAAADQAADQAAAAAANQAAAREFDVPMSRGQATGDPSAIRFEDLAAREAHGKPAQDIAAPFFENQFQAVQDANRRIGERFARGSSAAENPSEAAATINAELGEQGAQARAAVQAAEAAAEREAAAARGMIDDQGRALSDVIAGGRPPIENPREAGEVVGQAVRSAAARSRANYQGLYDEALGLPGLFRAEAFDGIGTRIQDRLMRGNNPVPIDDVTTPIASRAIRNLENISNLRFQNRADSTSVPPFGAPHPDSVVAVDLRGVDQARKQLVAYYRSARGSPNAADARAAGRLIDEFDNEIEQAISNGLFVGDPRALDAIQQARAAYSNYARQFRPQQAGDDVGTAMRRIIDRNATPEEIANMVVGSGRIGDRGLPVRIAGRLEEVLGRDTEAWSSIREAIWQKASRVRGEAGGVNTQGIDDLVGSSLGRRMFNDAERNAMRTHSAAVRDLDNVIENLGATRAAERSQAEYQRIFGGQDIGGQQGAVFRRIIDGTATAEETAQAVFSTISGNPGNARRVVGAIEGIVGRDSETMALVRYGVWQRLTQNAATKDQPGYQKVSQAIGEFLEGKGRSIATALYTPEEIALMQRYQAVLKRLVIPKNARTNSDTAPALLGALRNYGSAITAVLGHSVDKVIGKTAGAAVKTLIRGSANVIGNARAAQKVARSLSPIDQPPPTSTLGPTPATEASPLIQTLSRSLATRGGHRDNRYARGGRTDAKPSKAQTHYRLGSRRKRCEICTMFRAPHTCTAIVGKVSKIGLCDLFERKPAYAEGGEVTDTDDNVDPFERAAARAQARYLGRNVVGMQRGPAEGDVLPDVIRTGIADKLADVAAIGSGAAEAEFGPQYGFTREDARKEFEGHPGLARQDPTPPGFMSRVGSETVRMGLDPTSWVGPGSLGYKAAWNAASGLGGETAGTMAAGTRYEPAARFAGSFTPAAVERALPAVGRLVPPGSLGSLGGSMVIPSERAAPFYSAAEQAVAGMKMSKAPAAQWLGSLRNAPGVRPAELEHLGLEAWLGQQQGPVSKQALADYIAQNKVQLGETVRGIAPDAEAAGRALAESRGHVWPDGLSRAERERFVRVASGRRITDYGGDPKYSQYQLPGGENYRETLLTLPDRTRPGAPTEAEIVAHAKEYQRKYSIEDWDSLMQSERRAFIEKSRKELGATKADNYRGGHWDEPNVLAHYRTNERDIGGKKTLFLEEAQSDWHQAGRKQGYGSMEERKQAITDQLNKLANEWETASPAQRNEIGDRMNLLHDRMTDLRRGPETSIPKAPFSSNWHELALKRAIRDAAERGMDQIAWTPGSVQNRRYPDPNRPDAAMEAFYDKMLPAAANKLGKPHGAQVGQDRLLTNPEGWHLAAPNETVSGKWMVKSSDYNSRGVHFDTKAEAEAFMADKIATGKGAHTVHTLPITPSLREQALRKGFPLFAAPVAAGAMGSLAAQDKEGLARGGRTGSTQFLARMRAAMGGRTYAEGGEVDDELLPPPYLREPQSRAGPALGEMAAQPFRDMAKGLGSGMTEDEAKDYFMGAMAGLVPMGRAAKPAARALREAVAEVAPGAAGLARTAPETAPRALFDYSRIGEVPDVPQFDLPRYNPKHGVSDRVADLIANKKVRQQTMDYLERGHQSGAGTFYGTQPLREAFVDELGRKEGPDAFRRYMEFVGGTSPRSTVPENARNASYYYVLDRQGQPMPMVGSRNEQPYGHLAQKLHQRNAQTITGPGWDVFKNPKPPSFIENLAGNWQPVTVDAHAFKLPGMVSKDPRFLAGSMVLEKGGPTINPSELYQSGDLTMKQALKRPAFWASKPNANEYAAMENYWKGMARELGYPAPAYGQASGWSGGGELTGLKSVSAEPFLRAVENRAILTAAERGLSPAEALSQFMRGKAPLLSGAGAAGLGALAHRDRHDEQ